MCCLGLNGHLFRAAGTYILLDMILSSKIYTETVSITFYVVKWDILSSRMEFSDYQSSLYPAVRLVLLSNDIRYAKNALSRFNVTSVVRAAIGSVNLLAK